MFKFITFPLFLLIFLNSNAFATTYKYLCRGDGSRVVLQFDESKKLVITNNQKPHKYKIKDGIKNHINIKLKIPRFIKESLMQ